MPSERGKKREDRRDESPAKPDRVEEASDESFPASDPPAHGAPRKGETHAGAEVEAKPSANGKPDDVDESSEESFPASDPRGGTSHV